MDALPSHRALPGSGRPARGPVRGLTLIELMIVIVVVGILGVIALPAYHDAVRKSRRSEGILALMQIQQAQERWRANHADYASSVSNAADGSPPGLGLADVTPSGYYALSIESATATGYIATAVGRTGTSQASDPECRTLRVRLTGGNLGYAGCGGTGECTAFAASHPCFAR